MPEQWTLYLVECEREFRWYVGISANPIRRIAQHKSGHGSVCTRKYGVRAYWFLETFLTKSEALYAEDQMVRALRHIGKLASGSWVPSNYSLLNWRYSPKGVDAQREQIAKIRQREEAKLRHQTKMSRLKQAAKRLRDEKEREWRRQKEAYATGTEHFLR